MSECELCGNEYEKTFKIILNGETHVFDSFECAIQMLAPSCPHCGCLVIGHGVDVNGSTFCCAHCARSVSEEAMKEHAVKEHA